MIAALLTVAVGWINITVYHVNPYHMGSWPINMNTANVEGDIFFDLRSAMEPMECRQDPQSRDCTNPEVTANDLVISKLILNVDETQFGTYGKCNICINGTDHHGDNHCVDGTYVCDCSVLYNSTHVDCGPQVGVVNLSAVHLPPCEEDDPEWSCWRVAVANKTGGMWYSTTSKGYCGNPNATECTWRVAEIIKVVNKTCSDDHIYKTVESKNETCFHTCGPRNVTSDCWISCFYNTILGPDSGVPGGVITGLPLSDLVDMWNFPFSDGSCPGLPPKKGPFYPHGDFSLN